MIRMLIIDDEYYIRVGLSRGFDWSSMGIEIAGEAEDGAQGLSMAVELRPDLILMDISMPILNGLDLMAALRKREINCAIIVISGYDEFSYAQQSIRYGVTDYLLKPVDKQKLRNTIAKACEKIQNDKNLKNYQKMLEQEQASIQNQVLREILSGNLPDNEKISRKIETARLPLLNGFYYTFCIKIDDYAVLERKLNSDEIRRQNETLAKCLDSFFLLGKKRMGMVTSMSVDEWGVLLSYSVDFGRDDAETLLKKDMEDFLEEYGKTGIYTFSVSVSPAADTPETLPLLYRECRLTNKKYIPGQNSIVWFGSKDNPPLRHEIVSVMNFIENHYDQDITIQQVADSLYMSSSYLMHMIKNDTGETFSSLLVKYRIEKAKELLKTPSVKIQDVSKKVGYSDVKYFNKLFKKYTSFTPSEYVKTYYV